MAPLRAHLSHLFETEKTARKVSFWYGARSKQEIFYDDYFLSWRKSTPTFAFTLRSHRRCRKTDGAASPALFTK
jgi:Na+-transporting NADH:ubiquinone oxidoreductase subunit F